jgi:hypothetical protein
MKQTKPQPQPYSFDELKAIIDGWIRESAKKDIEIA